MHNHKPFLTILAALLIGLASGMLVHARKAAAPRLAPGRVPPSGDYACSKTIWANSFARNIDGTPMMTIQYIPSVLGTLRLDGKGGYLSRKKPGRYKFNAAKRQFAFVSGPLAGWPVVYEVSSGTAMLRLGATMKDKVGADSRIGEHTCRLRGSAKFADSPPPASVGGPETVVNSTTTGRNGGARGVLTFGDGKIMDLDLASGALKSRFEGSHPFRTSRGETVFINRSDALVIAGAGGTATATVPLPEDIKRPDAVVMSPDGGKIALHVEPVYYDSRVFVVTRAGKVLAEFKDMTEPDWTPDGRLLVARSTGTEGAKAGIFLSDANLKQLTRIDPNLDSASQPVASPDGRRIAFAHHGHIWLMGMDGSGLKQLSSSGAGERNPSWSPDGKWIVATSDDSSVVVTLISLQSGKMTTVKDKENDVMQSRSRVIWR